HGGAGMVARGDRHQRLSPAARAVAGAGSGHVRQRRGSAVAAAARVAADQSGARSGQLGTVRRAPRAKVRRLSMAAQSGSIFAQSCVLRLEKSLWFCYNKDVARTGHIVIKEDFIMKKILAMLVALTMLVAGLGISAIA